MEKICVFGRQYYENTVWDITAEKNGKYINLKKYGDDKKEYRYDISTGKFERINHYKKGDKITPVKTKNITKWFTDCGLFCTDEKFAKLIKTNARTWENNRYKSIVRYIEALSSEFSKTYEAWLSLGVEIEEVKKAVENNYHVSSWSLGTHPSQLTKEQLKFITDNYKVISRDEINFIKDMPDMRVFNKLRELAKTTKYSEIFEYTQTEYDYSRPFGDRYVKIKQNLFNPEKELSTSGRYIVKHIIDTINDFNLDIISFCDYLLRLKHVECLDVHDLFNTSHYPDYLKMEKVLKRHRLSKIDKYPKYFLSQFKITQAEYKVMKTKYSEEMFKAQCDIYRSLTSKYDKYQIVVPEATAEIENEADELKHCVRSYIQRVVDGETLIVFLRDNESPETPLVTIEVRNGEVIQAYGERDRKPEQDQLDTIRLWAKEKGLQLSWCWGV